MVDQSRLERLAASSQAADKGAGGIPRCFKNHVKTATLNLRDADGNPIIKNKEVLSGGFFVYTDNNGNVREVTDFTAIVVDRRVQYQRFTKKADGKYIYNRTVMESNFKGTFKDTLGGHKLGKITGEAAKELDPAAKESNKQKGQCSYLTFMLILDDTGLVPCMLSKGGMELSNALSTMFKDTKGSIFHTVTFGDLVPKKNGGVSWYGFTPTLTGDVDITDEILDAIEEIHDAIAAENEYILSQHEKARATGGITQQDEEEEYTDEDLEVGE